MTAASRAIELFAEATGTRHTAAIRIARAMRETDPSLWPQGSHGRGTEAHIEPTHLVNLLLGAAVGSPLIAAPGLVMAWRSFAVVGVLVNPETSFGFVETLVFPHAVHQEGKYTLCRGVFGGDGGLGGDLARLVELLAASPDETIDKLAASAFRVTFYSDPFSPRAVIRWRSFDQVAESEVELLYVPPQTMAPGGFQRIVADALQQVPPEAPIVRTATVNARLFGILADMWRGTIAHREAKAAAAAAKGNAGPLPGEPAPQALPPPDKEKEQPDHARYHRPAATGRRAA